MIYFDNSATTPISPEVREAMMPYLGDAFGNASSVHRLGSRAKVALEDARGTIASYIHSDAREIIFTSGGTEANNLAVKGPFFHHHFRGVPWSKMRMVTSSAEHHSVLYPAEFLGKLGVEISTSEVDGGGHTILENLSSLLIEETVLTSMMMVNNEIGAINPIAQISETVKTKTNGLMHTDAVQALGKIPIDVRELGVDLLTISAHKVHGPKGIGAFYSKAGIEWEPMIHGGAQERNRRGGTESVALAVGFGEAVRQLTLRDQERREHLRALHEYTRHKLTAVPQIVLNTNGSSANGILNFSFTPDILAKLDSDALLIRFDLEGIAVSNGSACTSGSQQPSHVLMAMGKGKEVANKSIRISQSQYNTRPEIDRFIEILKRIIES